MLSSLSTIAMWLLADSGPSMFDARGPHAAHISSLWWVFFWILAAVYVITMMLVMYGVGRAIRRKEFSSMPEAPVRTNLFESEEERQREQRMKLTVGTGVVISAAILVALMVSSFSVGNDLGDAPSGNPLHVNVIGHQWWWEFRYVDTIAANGVVTSNELHIPTGRPVMLHLTSHDVIHSFWAPNFNGKRDAIPGYNTSLWFQSKKDGTYRGTCAEFCGHQHAKMGFLIMSEAPHQFQQWIEHSKQDALQPTDSMAKRGKEVFLAAPCSNCHTIQGTPAGGHVGPELTHFGSKQTFASATYPNKIGYLTGWLLDPQSMKPGCKMPQNVLEPRDARAVAEYLESLK
jgi:cytochrome c oxidase subunit 2